MEMKDLVVNETRVKLRNCNAPLDSDGYDHGLIVKKGRKYITMQLDRPRSAGFTRNGVTERIVTPDLLLPE